MRNSNYASLKRTLEEMGAFVITLLAMLIGFLIGIITNNYITQGTIFKYFQTKRRYPMLNAKIESILQSLKFDTDRIIKLQEIIRNELTKGLSNTTHYEADVKMIPSYVRYLPMGNERGTVLALDLGGTNFRVLKVQLLGGGKKPIVSSKVFIVPRSIMMGSGNDLFDYLAESLYGFLKTEHLTNAHLSLGFTFSFPCNQNGLSSAKLSSWTKGFKCEGVIGKDVVMLLQRAIDAKGMNVKVTALINDTVGTLVSCAYGDPTTAIGVIIGTGFNACYIENINEVGIWDGDYNEPNEVIVNTEWGALGSDGCIEWLLTPYDKEVDRSSINPGKQIFEKLVSGMFMGEIVRNIILDLMEKDLLFMNDNSLHPKIYRASLGTPGAFLAKYVSDIESDDGIGFSDTAKVLQQLGVPNAKFEDCAIIQYICKLVSKRAGVLVAVGLSCLIERIMRNRNVHSKTPCEIVVGIDGSVYRYHPKFHKNIMKPLSRLLPKNITCSLKLSNDGSGIGAALVAYIDSLHNEQNSSATSKVNFVLE
ncbi:hypothetical protein GJ496_005053 [Pomphorhynchus laevis]|nr:hypothetical protein GJ496_005053 [Pomphorhynchus laevis]